MNLKTHPHRSDLLTLTKSDLDRIAAGETLQVSALIISLEEEPKPDVVMTRKISILMEPCDKEPDGLVNVGAGFGRNVRFVFDGETRKLKHVEML